MVYLVIQNRACGEYASCDGYRVLAVFSTEKEAIISSQKHRNTFIYSYVIGTEYYKEPVLPTLLTVGGTK